MPKIGDYLQEKPLLAGASYTAVNTLDDTMAFIVKAALEYETEKGPIFDIARTVRGITAWGTRYSLIEVCIKGRSSRASVTLIRELQPELVQVVFLDGTRIGEWPDMPPYGTFEFIQEQMEAWATQHVSPQTVARWMIELMRRHFDRFRVVPLFETLRRDEVDGYTVDMMVVMDGDFEAGLRNMNDDQVLYKVGYFK